MKRSFFVVMFILFAAALAAPCRAEAEPVDADIWVEVRHGGTAELLASPNSPAPEQTTLTVPHGQRKAFTVSLTQPGSYSYTVRLKPDRDHPDVDETYYDVTVYVAGQPDGTLDATIVTHRNGSDEKYAPPPDESGFVYPNPERKMLRVLFSNIVPESSDDDDPSPSTGGSGSGGADTPGDPGGDPGGGPSGDPGSDPGDPGGDPGGDPSGDPGDPGDDPGSPGGDPGDPGGEPGNPGDPGDPGEVSGTGGQTTNQPKTGDDSGLNRYLLAAMLSSAGLFALSLGYLSCVERERRAKR